MAIFIRLSTTLRSCVPGYDPAEGMLMENGNSISAGNLAHKIGLPLDEIKITMINGRRVTLESMVADGDRVAYFPAVGGG